MKRFLLIFLSVVSAGAANAQMVAAGRAGSMDLLELGSGYLTNPAVQKELGLSSAVSKKITDKYLASMDAMMKSRPPLTPPKDENSRKAMQSAFEAQAKKMRQTLRENLALLTPPQKARLKQIALQQAGARGLLNPEIKKALNLNPTQEQKIGTIVREGSAQMFAGMRNLPGQPGKPEDMRKRMAEFSKKREEGNQKMLAESVKILKPDQVAKWKALQGKPFKMDMMAGMPRMRQTTRIN